MGTAKAMRIWLVALWATNKLSRTYAALVDALNRHRGKGQQKVTVEHVHVHAGGHAIVGSVERPPPDNSSRSENQHDARQITHAPQPAMRSPNVLSFGTEPGTHAMLARLASGAAGRRHCGIACNGHSRMRTQ
jgi:hypothetical protein